MAIQKERRATPRKSATKTDKPAARPEAAPAAKPSVEPRAQLDAEGIKRLIAETAYFKAKQRGFTPGYELEDWVQAEAEVRNRLGAGR